MSLRTFLIMVLAGLMLVMPVHAQDDDTDTDDDFEINCAEDGLRAALEASDAVETIILPEDCTLTLSADLPTLSKDLTITGNGAVIDGAGDFRAFHVVPGGDLTLESITIQNTSGTLGGAMYITGGSVQMHDVLIQNSSDYGGFGGGALLVSGGEVQITGSTFYQNVAHSSGGALAIFGGEVSVENSTFGGNIAHYGGAISVHAGAVNITSSTLVQNSAEAGGAIFKDAPGVLLLGQSIVADNDAGTGTDISFVGALASEGYNLFGSTDFVGEFSFDASDLLDDNPELTEFSGRVYPLNPLSLALDAVPEDACAVDDDQRGMERPVGAGCDIGAVEMEQTGEMITVITREVPELVSIPGVETDAASCMFAPVEGAFSFSSPENVFCTVLMQNEGWVTTPGSVPQSVIDRGVILAVEVFSMAGGEALTEFVDPLPVCLRGQGRMIYLDAADSPRVERELPSVAMGAYTCTFVPEPGTLALVYRFRSE